MDPYRAVGGGRGCGGRSGRVRRVGGDTITTIAGTGTAGFVGDGGQATSAQLNQPWGVAVDTSGNVYIGDTSNNRVRKVSGGNITTVAGTGAPGYSGDGGQATSAQLNLPKAVAVDAQGNLYIADYGNNRIRKVCGGIITTVAGNGHAGVFRRRRPGDFGSAELPSRTSQSMRRETSTSPISSTIESGR